MVGLTLARIVLDVASYERAAAFWCGALGYEVAHRSPEFWKLVDPRDAGRCQIGLQPAEEPKRGINALHLEVFTDDMRREAARLESLGASRAADWPYPDEDCNWIVMRDPDGHEFCIVERPSA